MDQSIDYVTTLLSMIRGGSAGIRNLYSYVTSSGDIRYDNRSYAAIVQRKSRVRGQISAPSVSSCVCSNKLSFKICVFQVVESPQSRRDRCQVKIGTPKNRHPGCPISRKNKHPDAYIHVNIGIRVPIFTVNMGIPL